MKVNNRLVGEVANNVIIWGFIFLMFYISYNPDKLGNWFGIFIHYNDNAQIKLNKTLK